MSYKEERIDFYRGWNINKAIDNHNNGLIDFYSASCNYQYIYADRNNIERLYAEIDRIEDKRLRKQEEEKKKKEEEKRKNKLGIITVDNFEDVIKMFGFDHPVTTVVWNTMEVNPNNKEDFEIVYHRYVAGKY